MENHLKTVDPIDLIDLNLVSAGEFDRLCHQFIVTNAHSTGLDLMECELVCNDILHKIFVQHSFGNFSSSRGGFRAYLASSARNLARNYIRRNRHYDFQPPEILEITSDSTCGDDSLERRLQAEENSELLHTAIGILRTRLRNPIQAEALVLNSLEEKPIPEVARLLDMTPQQVSLACCRCRKMLKGIIIELKEKQEC